VEEALGSACGNDLSQIGAGDFEVSFTITTTATNTGVLGQRRFCWNVPMWDVRVDAGGELLVETSDGGSGYSAVSSTIPVNDGLPHAVTVSRTTGLLAIRIDGVAAGSGTSMAAFGPLPALGLGAAVCDGIDGSDGSLTDVCIRGGGAKVTGPCLNNLSQFGQHDFRIAFTVQTTGTNMEVLGQRAVCSNQQMWDVRIGAAGTLLVETSDGGSAYSAISSTIPVNDGRPHAVLLSRGNAWISIQIDNVIAGGGDALAALGALPPLALGVGVCDGIDGTRAFDGSLTDVCIGGPPSCTDHVKNQDETDVDCGGKHCGPCAIGQACAFARDCGCTLSGQVCASAKPCSAGRCVAWCNDPDGDGYGDGNGCLGPDCDQTDPKWATDCWLRDLFGPRSGWPRTVQRPATLEIQDNRCVVNFRGSGCFAQNSPPCVNVTETRTTTLDVTMQADGTLRVAAPYQDMCTADYVGAVIDAQGRPTGEAVATSYPVPMPTTFWYYAPKDFDKCRADINGADYPVQNSATAGRAQDYILITQDCITELRDDTGGPGSGLLSDIRHYWTKVKLR
jgi:hypothetical protein